MKWYLTVTLATNGKWIQTFKLGIDARGLTGCHRRLNNIK
jgi:hypothetical protein